MRERATRRSRAVRIVLAPLLALTLAACGGGGGSAPPAPFILATAVGFTPRAAGTGLEAGAAVLVLDATTAEPIAGAAVTVNGTTLGYDATVGAYEGLVASAAGSPVVVSVAVGGQTYRATGQLDAYPALTAPAPGATWSALAPQTLAWQAGAPLTGAAYAVGVVDAADPNGAVIWPADQQFEPVPTSAGTFTLPPGSLTGGARVVVVGLLAVGPLPGAAEGSALVLSGFDAVPITVTVGTPVASGPGPVNLLAAGGRLLWSDGEAPVKSVPAGGGPVTRLVERRAMPEAVFVAGPSLYWIAGQQLLRSARDGSGVAVLAEGPRNAGSLATAADLVVDGAAAYWVNVVPDPGCSPACRWAIVRVPLDGGAPATLATTVAEPRGLAADAATIYWVQQGSGPVSQDGNGPADSGVWSVPKAGGAPVRLVNGFLNGPPPVLDPGFIPGNWIATGGLLEAGGQLHFAQAIFHAYRILRVSVAGGAVAELQLVAGAESIWVRAMATDGERLAWTDGGSVKVLPLAGGAAADLASGLHDTTGLAVAAGRVIWSELACCAVRANGSVRSVPLAGGQPLTLAGPLENPSGVAADAQAVFWVEGGAYGAIEGYGRIATASHQGGGAATVLAAFLAERPPMAADAGHVVVAERWRAKAAPLAGGPLEDVLAGSWTITAVASDGAMVWALNAFGSLARAPLAGGPIEQVFPGPAGVMSGPDLLRIGGGHVYWVDQARALRRVPLAGGAAETVATGLGGLSDLEVDGQFAYLAPAAGALQRVPVTGGTPVTVGSGEHHAGARLALDGGRLYWIDGSRLGRITLASGEDQVLAIGLAGDPALGNDVAVDASGLYWIESGSGVVKRSDDR